MKYRGFQLIDDGVRDDGLHVIVSDPSGSAFDGWTIVIEAGRSLDDPDTQASVRSFIDGFCTGQADRVAKDSG